MLLAFGDLKECMYVSVPDINSTYPLLFFSFIFIIDKHTKSAMEMSFLKRRFLLENTDAFQ